MLLLYYQDKEINKNKGKIKMTTFQKELKAMMQTVRDMHMDIQTSDITELTEIQQKHYIASLEATKSDLTDIINSFKNI